MEGKEKGDLSTITYSNSYNTNLKENISIIFHNL